MISLKTDCFQFGNLIGPQTILFCYNASVCLLDITMPAHTNLHLTITSLYWQGIEALKALEIFSAPKQSVQHLLAHYTSFMFKSMIISKQQIFIQYQIVYILLGNFTYLAFVLFSSLKGFFQVNIGLMDQMSSHKVGVPSTLTTFFELHLTNQGKPYKQRVLKDLAKKITMNDSPII